MKMKEERGTDPVVKLKEGNFFPLHSKVLSTKKTSLNPEYGKRLRPAA